MTAASPKGVPRSVSSTRNPEDPDDQQHRRARLRRGRPHLRTAARRREGPSFQPPGAGGLQPVLGKQFNPDRNFFDHVKVLRPFPVDGYDFHGIGRAGETGFWSESFIAGTVDDEKMSRILDLYDWLYSSDGTMTVMFGVEGQDYRMDGADIVPLKTDADGNMQVASDLYPIMSVAAGFSYLANWPEDAAVRQSENTYARPPSPRSSWFSFLREEYQRGGLDPGLAEFMGIDFVASARAASTPWSVPTRKYARARTSVRRPSNRGALDSGPRSGRRGPPWIRRHPAPCRPPASGRASSPAPSNEEYRPLRLELYAPRSCVLGSRDRTDGRRRRRGLPAPGSTCRSRAMTSTRS